MKKYLILILFLCCFLIGCGNLDISNNKKRIELTKDNYTDYIALFYNDDYVNFYGSTICKFEDVIIKYTYYNNDAISNGTAVIEQTALNISGCGQIKYYKYISLPAGMTIGCATIIDVTGYVTVLY